MIAIVLETVSVKMACVYAMPFGLVQSVIKVSFIFLYLVREKMLTFFVLQIENDEMEVDRNTTSPGVVVTDPSGKTFYISLASIQEKDENEKEVGDKIKMHDVNFYVKEERTYNSNKIYNYTATLKNGAFLSVTVSTFFYLLTI